MNASPRSSRVVTRVLLAVIGLSCIPAVAAPPSQSPCEVTGEIVEVAGDRVILALRVHGEVVVPKVEMTVLRDGRAVGTLKVESVSGAAAVATPGRIADGQVLAPGMQVMMPCPLPISAVGERGAFIALPLAHGLANGARLVAWRKEMELGVYELVLPASGAPYVRPAGANALRLRAGDICYAIGEAAPSGLERSASQPEASSNALVVTAVDDQWIYLWPGPNARRPSGRYLVKRDGRPIASIELTPSGPIRAEILAGGPSSRVRPGDLAEPLAEEVALAEPKTSLPPSASVPEAPVTPGAPPKSEAPGAVPGTGQPDGTKPSPPVTTVTQTPPGVAPPAPAQEPTAPALRPAVSRGGAIIAGPPLGVTFHGPTGLVRTPNAEVLPQGRIRLSATIPAKVEGSTIPDFREQWVLGIGLLPGLELGGAYNNRPLRDITLHGKLRLLSEGKRYPAIAVGASNLRPNEGEPNYYIVGSKTLLNGHLRASAGLATGSIRGAFGGVEARLTPWATGIVEYDSQRVNTALRLNPTPRIQIDLADMKGGFSAQGAYWCQVGRGRAEVPSVDLHRPEMDADDQALVRNLSIAVAALGMENVRVILGNTPKGLTAGITYENRRYYRDKLEPLGLVLAAAARALPVRVKYLSVVVVDHHVPVLRFGTLLGDYTAYVRGDIPVSRFRGMVSVDQGLRPDIARSEITAVASRTHSTSFSGDLSVTPTVRTIFGSEEITLAVRSALLPRLDVDLGGGWNLRAARDIGTGGHLPDLDFLFSDNELNIGTVFRAGSQIVGHVAGGDFADKRRGVAVEGFWMPRGTSILVRGFASCLQDRLFGQATPSDWAYLGDVRYRVSALDLEAGATFGKYLDGDRGFTVGLRRFFGDNDLRLEYRDTDLSKLLMLQATICIAPHRYPAPGRFRARLGDRVQVSQRATTGGGSGDTLISAALTGNQLRFFDVSDTLLDRDRLSPSEVLGHLDLLRSAAGASGRR